MFMKKFALFSLLLVLIVSLVVPVSAAEDAVTVELYNPDGTLVTTLSLPVTDSTQTYWVYYAVMDQDTYFYRVYLTQGAHPSNVSVDYSLYFSPDDTADFSLVGDGFVIQPGFMRPIYPGDVMALTLPKSVEPLDQSMLATMLEFLDIVRDFFQSIAVGVSDFFSALRLPSFSWLVDFGVFIAELWSSLPVLFKDTIITLVTVVLFGTLVWYGGFS